VPQREGLIEQKTGVKISHDHLLIDVIVPAPKCRKSPNRSHDQPVQAPPGTTPPEIDQGLKTSNFNQAHVEPK